MTIKEYITQELENFSETDLRQVAEYMTFIKFRPRINFVPLPYEHSDEELQSMYAEFEEEDLMLAEAGVKEYQASLILEDAETLSGESILPGFQLKLSRIFS